MPGGGRPRAPPCGPGFKLEVDAGQDFTFGLRLEETTGLAKQSPTNHPADRVNPSPPQNPPEGQDPGTRGHDEESGLAAGLRRFSRRLATFGLGETQQPLLTEEIWSIDANGNPR